MKNVKLILAYDGSNYFGWQKTVVGPTIQSSLQKALEQFLQHPVSLQAASRTDAGVHANGQVVNFFTSKNFELHRFQVSLNALLPKDIVVLHVEMMPSSFHPTLSCIKKEYHYFICYGTTQLPQHRLYSWHYHYLLDVEKMRQAACFLLGEHDFSTFCNFKKNQNYKNYLRQIEKIEIEELTSHRLCIKISGANFLYKMVRNLVGTLIYVGNQKIDLKQISDILHSKDRTLAGVTAPAHGLFLHQVIYN